MTPDDDRLAFSLRLKRSKAPYYERWRSTGEAARALRVARHLIRRMVEEFCSVVRGAV
jgi:hypothetical protein